MDDPRPQLEAALKEAMRSKDNTRRDVVRMSLNALKQVEIDTQQKLSAEEAVSVLQKEARKRRESIDEMEKAGRAELAAQERMELDILEEFLPRQLSREQVETLAREAIAQTGAKAPGDMGKVMGALMPRVKGMADGKLVNQIVRELLSG